MVTLWQSQSSWSPQCSVNILTTVCLLCQVRGRLSTPQCGMVPVLEHTHTSMEFEETVLHCKEVLVQLGLHHHFRLAVGNQQPRQLVLGPGQVAGNSFVRDV